MYLEKSWIFTDHLESVHFISWIIRHTLISCQFFSFSQRSLMSMIRKRSHPSGSGAKKEKAAQPETGNSHPIPLVYFLSCWWGTVC